MKLFKKILAQIVYKVIKSSFYKEIVYEEEQNKVKSYYNRFKKIGHGFSLPNNHIVKNPQYISIGNDFSALYNLRIEAWDGYLGDTFKPEIIIGNNVSLNTDVHIGCINKIVIGNNVLMASRIYISDHSHGLISSEELSVPPVLRKLYSKGPVIIEDNVWIGENVAILPGVRIGANSIIGANAVVTHDVPVNSVVGGNPARIIKQL